MTDKMTEEWIKGLYWDEGSEEDFWNVAKSNFIKRNEAERLQLMKAVNAWMDEEDQPTREAASLLTKQRELEHLHRTLKAAGR